MEPGERNEAVERGTALQAGELRDDTQQPSAEPVYQTGSDQPVDELENPQIREKQTDSWFRPLHDGRIEIMCRAPNYRIRVTAPEEQAWQAVELFERWTGLVVQSERRPPRVYAPPRGQLSMTELESEGN